MKTKETAPLAAALGCALLTLLAFANSSFAVQGGYSPGTLNGYDRGRQEATDFWGTEEGQEWSHCLSAGTWKEGGACPDCDMSVEECDYCNNWAYGEMSPAIVGDERARGRREKLKELFGCGS